MQINPGEKVSKSGDTMTGNLIINAPRLQVDPSNTNPNFFLGSDSSGQTAYTRSFSNDGTYAQFSTGNNYGANRSFTFPKKSGTLAVEENSVIPTTHGTLYVRNGVKNWVCLPAEAASIAGDNTYTWANEIPSGYRPSSKFPLYGTYADGNFSIKGNINGTVNTDGSLIFRTTGGSGNYYFNFQAIWV